MSEMSKYKITPKLAKSAQHCSLVNGMISSEVTRLVAMEHVRNKYSRWKSPILHYSCN